SSSTRLDITGHDELHGDPLDLVREVLRDVCLQNIDANHTVPDPDARDALRAFERVARSFLRVSQVLTARRRLAPAVHGLRGYPGSRAAQGNPEKTKGFRRRSGSGQGINVVERRC